MFLLLALSLAVTAPEKTGDALVDAFNLGVYHQRRGEDAKALEQFLHVVEKAPDDWHAHAKVVQTANAVGKIDLAEKHRRLLLDLHENGKVGDATYFCREQFVVGDKRVLGLEHFELKPPRNFRYAFVVSSPGGAKPEWEITVGSSDFTTGYLQRSGRLHPDQRVWTIDYYATGSRGLFWMGDAEPTYAEARKAAIDIILGKARPVTRTVYPVPTTTSGQPAK